MPDLEFNKNDDSLRLLISEMKRKHAILSLGGGNEKIKKQHAKGKLTAWERIDLLFDNGTFEENPNSRIEYKGDFWLFY